MDAKFITGLQEDHLASWNERDRAKRDEMMTRIYHADIKMYDPTFILNGINEISGFIDKVQSDPKFDFKSIKPMSVTQNGARLFWSIMTEKGELTGMDFFIIKDGKVQDLFVFIEQDI